MKGTIKDCRGIPDPNCYIIEDDDGKEYFAHIGDLRKNEKIEQSKEAEILQKGDKVEFEIFDTSIRQTAYHVRKSINSLFLLIDKRYDFNIFITWS